MEKKDWVTYSLSTTAGVYMCNVAENAKSLMLDAMFVSNLQQHVLESGVKPGGKPIEITYTNPADDGTLQGNVFIPDLIAEVSAGDLKPVNSDHPTVTLGDDDKSPPPKKVFSPVSPRQSKQCSDVSVYLCKRFDSMSPYKENPTEGAKSPLKPHKIGTTVDEDDLGVSKLLDDDEEESNLPPIDDNRVKLIGLPETMDKEELMYVINKELWASPTSFLTRPQSGLISVSEVDACQSVIVECASASIAQDVLSLKTLQYINKGIRICEFTRNDEDCLTKVVVSNVPTNTDLDYLCYTVNKILWNLKALAPPAEGISSINDDIINTNTVVVEMKSSTLAALLIEKKTIPLGQTTLTLKAFKKQDSVKVLVSNLPESYDKDYFVSILEGHMVSCEFAKSGAQIVKNFVEGRASNSLILEFYDAELSEKALLLETFFFKGSNIVLSQPCSMSVPPAQGTSAEYKIMHPQKLTQMSSEATAPSHQNVQDLDTTPLDSPHGRQCFVKSLIRTRQEFVDRKKYESGYVRIQEDLLEYYNIHSSLTDIKEARGKLRDKYNRQKKEADSDWDVLKPCSVLFGKKSVEILYGETFDPNLITAKGCSNSTKKNSSYADATFPQFAVWPVFETKSLIHAYKVFQTSFNSKSRHSHVWFKIGEKLFNEKGMLYSPDQCESKMLELKKKYRDIKDQLQKSGSDGPQVVIQWPYFYDMEEIMAEDVTVTCQNNVAMGTSNVVLEHGKEVAVDDRIGRSRPPTILKKASPLQLLVEAYQKRNDLLERSMTK